MLEKLKKAVEEDIGELFELRKCRRTFGQRALDEGHDIHDKDNRSATDEMLAFGKTLDKWRTPDLQTETHRTFSR